MAKQLQLTIPTPCHENWELMTPKEKGRFCDSCQKQVIDFSNMNDRQVADFFKKPSNGSVCGRFMTDQLDRSIEIPKKRIPWLKYFFQIALPAFMISCRNNGATMGKLEVVPEKQSENQACQVTMGAIMPSEITPVPPPPIPPPEPPPPPDHLVMGDVDTIVPVEEKVTGIDSKITDEICEDSTYVALPEIVVNAAQTRRMMGYVVGVTRVQSKGETCEKNKEVKIKKANISLDEEVNSAPGILKVYPNPVVSGHSLSIELKNVEDGTYQFQIINLAGQMIQQKQFYSDREAMKTSIDLPRVSAGSYFIILINQKNGKRFSEKIIVQ